MMNGFQRGVMPMRDQVEVTTFDQLRDARRLAFFLSTRRLRVAMPLVAAPQARSLERRLVRLQSACGCTAGALGLLAGLAFGVWQHGSLAVLCLIAFGAAAAGKVAGIATAYLLYHAELVRFTRDAVDAVSLAQQRKQA
jgi:hypothetical protein